MCQNNCGERQSLDIMNLLRTSIRKLRSFVRRCRKEWFTKKFPTGGPNFHSVFSIGIYTGKNPFDLKPAKGVTNPVLTASDVSDVTADFVADPFILRDGDQWHMFFEVMNRETQRGQISCATSTNGYQWQYQRIVLDEPFHLSYPYVFFWEGDYYMIPETYQARAIRLYKAVRFPFEWTFVKILVEGEAFVDASPFFDNDQWWMFAASGSEEQWYSADLRLFHANHLTGPWLEHPQSPLVKNDMHIARPAGRVRRVNGKIIRLTQDCHPLYGRLVRAFEVTQLTETQYQECGASRRPVLNPTGTGWNACGMHHMDAHLTDDGLWLACVDGWRFENKPLKIPEPTQAGDSPPL